MFLMVLIMGMSLMLVSDIMLTFLSPSWEVCHKMALGVREIKGERRRENKAQRLTMPVITQCKL